MRNPQRIAEMLDLIESIWKKHPDLRLGQLIHNSIYLEYEDLYDMEDDEFYRKLCETYRI